MNTSAIDIGHPALTATGEKVELSDLRKKNSFEITNFVMSQNRDEISFAFRVEGIVVKRPSAGSKGVGVWRHLMSPRTSVPSPKSLEFRCVSKWVVCDAEGRSTSESMRD